MFRQTNPVVNQPVKDCKTSSPADKLADANEKLKNIPFFIGYRLSVEMH